MVAIAVQSKVSESEEGNEGMQLAEGRLVWSVTLRGLGCLCTAEALCSLLEPG